MLRGGSARLVTVTVRFLPFLLLLACGCSRSEASAKPEPSPSPKDKQEAPLVLARGVRFVKPGAGDVAPLVRTELDKASADGRDVIVYVGAKWCEPCQKFHHAAQAGELDGEFPDLTIVEFDIDEDRDRVTAAGYRSRLIPLFVKPDADGRASTRRFEGGPKGDGAVASIAPRLKKILEK